MFSLTVIMNIDGPSQVINTSSWLYVMFCLLPEKNVPVSSVLFLEDTDFARAFAFITFCCYWEENVSKFY